MVVQSVKSVFTVLAVPGLKGDFIENSLSLFQYD